MTDVFHLFFSNFLLYFFMFKFLEMKSLFPDDEKKPLKVVIRESLSVYFASVLGIYLYSQFDLPAVSQSGGKKCYGICR